MKIKNLLFTLFFVSISVCLMAQTTFEVPKNVKLKNKADYANYEKDIIAASKWLVATDLSKEKDKRQEVNAFVLAWVSGSPNVSIELNAGILDLTEKNPQLLSVFLASYCRYVLEHKGEKGKFNPTKAAIQDMITVYKKGISVKKNKKLKKIIKKDNLDNYIIKTIGIAKGE